jgi:hypothetical protein
VGDAFPCVPLGRMRDEGDAEMRRLKCGSMGVCVGGKDEGGDEDEKFEFLSWHGRDARATILPISFCWLVRFEGGAHRHSPSQ